VNSTLAVPSPEQIAVITHSGLTERGQEKHWVATGGDSLISSLGLKVYSQALFLRSKGKQTLYQDKGMLTTMSWRPLLPFWRLRYTHKHRPTMKLLLLSVISCANLPPRFGMAYKCVNVYACVTGVMNCLPPQNRNRHAHLCLTPVHRLCARIICGCRWGARGTRYVCRPRRSCLVLVVSKLRWHQRAIIPDLHLHHQRTLSSTHPSESSISECVRLCDAHMAHTNGM